MEEKIQKAIEKAKVSNKLRIRWSSKLDLNFLKELPNLERLTLEAIQVKDLTPISKCKNLEYLHLDGTPVKDLTPLANCQKLNLDEIKKQIDGHSHQ